MYIAAVLWVRHFSETFRHEADSLSSMKSTLWLKIFLTPIVVILAVYNFNIGFETFGAGEKACFAWSAKTSFSCTVSFLPAGFQAALSRDILFATLFEGQTVEMLPSPGLGFSMLTGWMLFYLALFGALIAIVSSLWQKRESVKEEVQKPLGLQLTLFALLLFTIGFTSMIIVMLNQHSGSFNTHAVTIASKQPSAATMALVVSISTKIAGDRISAQELEQVIVEGLASKTIDGKTLVRLFDFALSKCREDLTQVILKYPSQPSPKDYDAKYMRSLYASVTNPACERIYREMGWADGCEVDLSGDVCESFDFFEKKYFATYQEKQDRRECKTTADCFASESGLCGRAMVGSKFAFSADEIYADEKMRCQLNKLKYSCSKANVKHLECDKLEQAAVDCKNSVCILVPFIN